jgi:hypothetical protein
VHILRIASESDRPDQLTTGDDVVPSVIFVRVSFKDGIRGEVQLRDEGLITGRRDKVVDVLANATGIVPGHDRIERIVSGRIGNESRTVAIAVDVIVAEVVGLPDFKGGIRVLSITRKNATPVLSSTVIAFT